MRTTERSTTAPPSTARYAEGLAAEFGRRVEINGSFQEDLESLEPTDALADDYDAFVQASADYNDNEDAVLDAAAAGDADEANALLSGDATTAYGEAADALGACGNESGDLTADVAEATDAAADAPQPSNTIDEAAQAYIDALKSGDCQAIADANHSQNYAEPAEDCSETAELEKDTEVLATVQFGPVGAAVVGTSDSNGYLQFMLDPVTGDLAYTSTIYAADNGLEPPNEGIDADETVAAAVDAIRADDPDALNATLSDDQPEGGTSFLQKGSTIETLGTDPEFADRIVADIKADAEAEPVLLGVDQVEAYYLLDTEETDYVLIARHDAGSETHYAFTAYWAISE